ncbi:MAG: hypothetical protein OEY19_00995 [Gammaproteobacteria bacterium]|nr:hypothetical protein [Gammaproteobacteria bacterium]MDH5630562.1 hypothetical protein [Gammaproteobacteria bacterium]
MKIAARFPIKENRLLQFLIISLHLFLLIFALNVFSFKWQFFLIFLLICISFYYSIKHYQRLTNAPDDLCWNGNAWLIQLDEKLKTIAYLELQPESWISSHYCLLHFDDGKQKYHWFFAKNTLGERLYSQLIYLVKQDIVKEKQAEI